MLHPPSMQWVCIIQTIGHRSLHDVTYGLFDTNKTVMQMFHYSYFYRTPRAELVVTPLGFCPWEPAASGQADNDRGTHIF
jgi:hypothetical protein